MHNINMINKKKLELIKELTTKEIRLALLNLWNKYYDTLLMKMNVEKANTYLKQIEFIKENANRDEWHKLDKKEIYYKVEMMQIELCVDLRFLASDLGKNSTQMVFHSIYTQLKTFNTLFSLINEDSLNDLNNKQSLNLANEIASCKIAIKRFNIDSIIPHIKKTDNDFYNRYLKEKETFTNNINSTMFPDQITKYMEYFEVEVNERLEKKEQQEPKKISSHSS